MRLTLAKLQLRYFKGAENLTFSFEEGDNFLYGANGTMKTTVKDAFSWLLFGKDSEDRKLFAIKTLDSDGNIIPRVEHEVEGDLFIEHDDGYREPLKLRRNYHEVWTRKNGDDAETFSQNTTDYYINNNPIDEAPYKARINEICNEEIFKLVTNPHYFPTRPKELQKNMLFELAGGVTDNDVLLAREDRFVQLQTLLTHGNQLDTLKKENDARIKIVKAEVKTLPKTILEAQKAIPTGYNWKEIEKQITDKQKKITENNKSIKDIDDIVINYSNSITIANDKRAAELKVISQKEEILTTKKNSIRSELFNDYDQEQLLIQTKRNEITSIKNEITACNNNIDSYNKTIATFTQNIEGCKENIKAYKEDIEILSQEFEAIRDKKLDFKEDQFTCPFTECTCESVGILEETATKKFNNKKAEDLKDNNAKGSQIVASIEAENRNIKAENEKIAAEKVKIEAELKKIVNHNATIITKQAEIDTLNTPKPTDEEVNKVIEINPEVISQLKVINDLTEKQTAVETSKTTEEDKTKKEEYQTSNKTIQEEIDELNKQLGVKTTIKTQEDRVQELKKQLIDNNQELAKLEKLTFEIEDFEKTKINLVEERINGKFSIVKFKMFNQQNNGGESQTCEATINGVSYANTLNTAAKLNAGLDIINAFSKQFNVYAPIFIDNRESVCNIIPTKSQVINLVVCGGNKVLDYNKITA